MANIQPKGLPKTICPICKKTYVHNGHFLRHIKAKHPGEVSEILEKQSEEAEDDPDHIRLNNSLEVEEMDIDDILPAGTPILIDKVEYYTDRPQPVDDNVDMDIYRQRRYPNPYTPFLDEHELEWAF